MTAMSSTTSITLLNELRDGSAPMAWEEFFERYWRSIYAWARRRGCSEQTSEDIVQDVMLSVFHSRDIFQYDETRGRFRDWLSAVVRNAIALRRRRPDGRIRPSGGDDDGLLDAHTDEATEAPDAVWETTFDRSMLAAMLEVVRLETPARVYLAFELTTLSGLSGKAAARATGLTRAAVYHAKAAVLKRLKQLGAPYATRGQLAEQVRLALEEEPAPAVQRKLSVRTMATMRSRDRHGDSVREDAS